MYLDLKTRYWWRGMKKEIEKYVAGVTLASELRQSIRSMQVYFNPSQYQNGSGKK
jgi:hypothetical protein